MKLSQLEKRIPQALTNSKEIIQKTESRRAEVAGPDQRASKQIRPGHCANQIHPECSGGGLSRDPYINGYIACLKLASPAGNTFARGHPVISASMLTT